MTRRGHVVTKCVKERLLRGIKKYFFTSLVPIFFGPSLDKHKRSADYHSDDWNEINKNPSPARILINLTRSMGQNNANTTAREAGSNSRISACSRAIAHRRYFRFLPKT